MKKWHLEREWIGLAGGLIALAGFFLRYDAVQTLFDILKAIPVPFFAPLMILLTALAMALVFRVPIVAGELATTLLFGALILLGGVLWVFRLDGLRCLGPGAYLTILGLMGIILGTL